MSGKGRRGFRYPLEALRRKYDWDLQQEQAELARRSAESTEAHVALRQAGDRLNAACEAGRDILDPSSRRLLLGHIAQLSDAVDAARERFETAERERQASLDRLAEIKRFVDGLERHRDEAVRHFDREQAAQEAARIDEAWLQGSSWRKGNDANRE
ncbi:hypothetical protein [Chitinimonas lacunae]|uniref:Flagellar FliJ protein n=1 Tax=Chitinimonas lacunae TaxID=1963018 RepID=A0ABV8MYL0_9NEIS